MRRVLFCLVVAACGRATPFEGVMAEAFDVPPPPEHLTLDVGPVVGLEAPAPGATVTLGEPGHTVLGEVVDVRETDAGVVITVYVAEGPGDALLDSGPTVRVTVSK